MAKKHVPVQRLSRVQRRKGGGSWQSILRLLGVEKEKKPAARHFTIERLLRELRRRGGGSRQSVLRILGGKLDRHGAPFWKKHLEFEDPREGPRTVDVVQTNTCSFGHTIDDKVRAAGVCEIGHEVLCSIPGCLLQCTNCGAVVCRRHARTYGQKTYCRNCSWLYFWRKLCGLE